jgi:phosphoribosylamine--glycine ligase
MNILVVGGGGREHAIVWKIASQLKNGKIFAFPGNAGISEIANSVDLISSDYEALAEFASLEGIDLTIVGPEIPLSEGIVDIFQRKGQKIFGPTQKASLLESSKAWSKEFMVSEGVATGKFEICMDFESAKKSLERSSFPIVMKYDGLAAGKGVKIITEEASGLLFLEDIFHHRLFASHNPKVLFEEYLVGDELSYLVITDGTNYLPLASTRDYKRICTGDLGPNTGGMGAYSPVPSFDRDLSSLIERRVVTPTLAGLQKHSIPYVGVLYFGIMITAEGPKLLEYNVRFGDPETQVILPRLKSDLIEVMEASIEGTLHTCRLQWSDLAAVNVVLASAGYPKEYQKGFIIEGLDSLPSDILSFHAGTRRDGDDLLTDGGRVLNIVALDRTIDRARKRVYEALEKVRFEGKTYRTDIAQTV